MTDELGREAARESLKQVGEVAKRTRTMIAYRGGDVLFVVWGIIWAIGFTISQFAPRESQWAWLGLTPLGIVLTFVVLRRPPAVRAAGTDRLARRIGIMWGLLFVYVDLWLALLWPFLHPNGIAFWRHLTAVIFTAPMLAYVMMGLWLDNCMVWLGLGITALTVTGLLLLPGVFFLWLAAMGGGTLIATGLIIRRRWR